MNKKVFVFLSIIVIFTMALVGCGNQQEEKNEESSAKTMYTGEEGRITVYVSGPQKMVSELEASFEEKRGDVLNVFHTGSGPLRQKVWTELESGYIQADVIWGADPLMYISLKEKNVLMQYKSPEIEAMDTAYLMGDGYYTPVNARYGVIVYNKDRIDSAEKPSSWSDLMDSKWKKRLAMADATQSSMALALTAGLYQIQSNTWDYHEALKKNEIMLIRQNIEVISKVESGEVDAGIAPHDGIIRLIKQAKKKKIESPLVIVWPKEGAISCQRPIAIIKNDARPEVNDKLAKEYVDFVLSPTGQKIASKYGFITVRKDVENLSCIPVSLKSVTVDWRYASKHGTEMCDKFKNIMFSK
ncbi:MAG: extracellular solute-binding protein [Halanaerobiales bacterium]|nr:extracellular solute-binding protein [Halanaerobiales bacterium]